MIEQDIPDFTEFLALQELCEEFCRNSMTLMGAATLVFWSTKLLPLKSKAGYSRFSWLVSYKSICRSCI